MKKIVQFVLVLAILFFVFQFGINLFKNKHVIDYSLKKNNKKVYVHEEYYKDKKIDYYFFEITIGKTKFVFDINNSFNKQKEILKDIKLYEEDDLICISPVYIKNNNKSTIVCNVANEQYSYTSIKDNYDLKGFVESIENYNKDDYKSKNNSTDIDRNKVYKGNIYEEENIIVYNYDKLEKITKSSSSVIKFADYDIYQNELGILIDKYYIMPKYENKPEFKSFLIIDISKEEISELDFENKLSTNLYINGVVNNKLYLFDKSNLVQYEIDPKRQNYRIIGNKNTNGQYYDGEWNTKNIYEFSRKKLEFANKYPIKEKYVEAFETDKFYYYYQSNGSFYKVYKKNLNKPIYLFNSKNIKEISVVNDNIYFIKDNTLYRHDDFGTKKILVNKEFQYNYNNIYGVYIK